MFIFSVVSKPFFSDFCKEYYVISRRKLFLMNEHSKIDVNLKDPLSILSIVCNIKGMLTNLSSLSSSGAGIQSIFCTYSDSEIYCWYKQLLRSFSKYSIWAIILKPEVVLFLQPSYLKLFNGSPAVNILVDFFPFLRLSLFYGIVPGSHVR